MLAPMFAIGLVKAAERLFLEESRIDYELLNISSPSFS